jgi:predicted secreted Zn-dependent protease
LFTERDNYDDFLEMHFDHSLADECRTEESPKWHQEMAASDSGEIEKWIWNLKVQF